MLVSQHKCDRCGRYGPRTETRVGKPGYPNDWHRLDWHTGWYSQRDLAFCSENCMAMYMSEMTVGITTIGNQWHANGHV